MSFLDISDEKQLLVQVRPASRGLHLDLSRETMASSINCSPSSPTTTTSTTTTMHMMLTENEAARLRFEELQAQAEEADLSEVEATNCIYVAGVDKHNRPVVSLNYLQYFVLNKMYRVTLLKCNAEILKYF